MRFWGNKQVEVDRNVVVWRFAESGAPGELLHFFRPGEEGRRHVVTYILATLKKGGSQLFTVQDEGKIIVRGYCHGYLTIAGRFLPIRSGKAVQVCLNVFEDPENVAALTIWGYTEDWTEDEDILNP